MYLQGILSSRLALLDQRMASPKMEHKEYKDLFRIGIQGMGIHKEGIHIHYPHRILMDSLRDKLAHEGRTRYS